MKKISTIASALLIAGSVQAAPASLGYDYVELNGSIGKLGVEVPAGNNDFREDIRTTNFAGRWSGMITDNIYSTLDVNYLNGNGDKRFGPLEFELDTTQINYSVLIGGAFAVADGLDLFIAGGIGGLSQDSSLEINGNKSKDDLDVKETEFAWEFGVRKAMWQQGLEFEARVEGIGDQVALDLNLPIYINENVALVPTATIMEEERIKVNKSHSTLGLGLRISY